MMSKQNTIYETNPVFIETCSYEAMRIKYPYIVQIRWFDCFMLFTIFKRNPSVESNSSVNDLSLLFSVT